jgi:tetratricopeptide (TPR) repeat protein
MSGDLRAALRDRYRLDRELGRGGMATVYLAEDLKHHRQVAIKVLERDLAAAIGPERFLNEIEVAARFTHPHILPLHDSGEAAGFLYYVTPFIQGESLRQRLRREKQLPVEEAVRITRQVAAALDHAHRHGYDDDVTEVFAVQSRIASRVVEGLGLALLERERRALTLTPTRNAEAHDYYLRGLQHSTRADRLFDGRSTAVAIQLFEKAVALDPGFALAHAALSRAHRDMYWWAVDRRDERLAMAKQAADRALEIDPELLEARLALALYFYARFDYGEALAVLNELRERHPHNADVVASVAAVLRRQGQLANSATLWEEAVRLSPRATYLASNLGETYWLLRNFEAAEAAFSRANALGPGAPEPYAHRIQNAIGWRGATGEAWRMLEQAERLGLASEPLILHHRIWLHLLDRDFDKAAEAARHATGPEVFDWQFWVVPRAQWLGEIHGLRGEPEIARSHYDEARRVLEDRLAQSPADPRHYASLGIVCAGLGRAEDAVRTARRGVELLPMTKEALRGAYSVEALARVYTMTGHRDAAVAQLSELLSRPSHVSAGPLRLDPRWDPLRGHPRFEQLLREEGRESVRR